MDDVLKNQALALWMHGQHHHLRGDLARAIELYTKSLGLYPTAEAYTFRGWAYSFQGRLDEAIDECKKAIAVDPSFGNPYNDIGSYLILQEKLDEAIDWLERAKNTKRYDARHYPCLNLGRIYFVRGWLRRARAEFEEALAIHPDDKMALDGLSKVEAALN